MTGLDRFLMECLKKGGMTVLEWLVRLMNGSYDMGLYLWTGVVHVKCPCTKGRVIASNSRGVSSSSAVGKLYSRVLIKRVRAGTEYAIGEEQCGFRQGRGCMDQVFVIRQVCEKYLANGKDVDIYRFVKGI